MLDISIVGIVSVPKRSALEGRELSEDALFGRNGFLLVVEPSSLGNPPPPRGV